MNPTHVLDTCAFLDLVSERWTAASICEAFRQSPHPVILSVTVWEIARKFKLGKLTLPCEQEQILEWAREVCRHFRLEMEPLTGEVCHLAETLPLHHRDPFDRMIIARAHAANCPVITSDREFEPYEVQVLRHRR